MLYLQAGCLQFSSSNRALRALVVLYIPIAQLKHWPRSQKNKQTRLPQNTHKNHRPAVARRDVGERRLVRGLIKSYITMSMMDHIEAWASHLRVLVSNSMIAIDEFQKKVVWSAEC